MSLEYFRFVRSFNHINQKPFMLPNFPEFFQDSLLPFIVLVFAYVVFCFCRGPSGVSGTIKIRDTPMSRFKTGSLVIGLQVWALFIGTYHALLAYFLFPTENSLRINLSLLCPNPGRLNPKLFIWTPYTSFCLIMGLAPGIARLQAFWMLGKDFTLHLAEPDRLVRDGFYRYARHPSYALWAVTWWSAIALLGRVDGTSACVTPTFLTSYRQFHPLIPYHAITATHLNTLVLGFWIWYPLFLFAKRIPEEDAMLRRKFGQEFDAYERQTAVFCPGIW